MFCLFLSGCLRQVLLYFTIGTFEKVGPNFELNGVIVTTLCFQKRGSCNCECAPCGKENSGGCSDCCISLSETCDCDCCKPSTDSCLDSCCPKNKVRLAVSVLGTRSVLFIAFLKVANLLWKADQI